MQRSNLPFPAWADHNMLQAVSARIYSLIFTPPSLIHLEAEARGHGNWQFFVVRPQNLNSEGYLSLALTCQSQKAAVNRFLFASTDFELTIVPSASPGFTRIQDPHSMISGLRRLDIWLTPEISTRSRSDCVAKIDVDRNGKVSRCTVDMQFIPGNVPVSVTDREMRVERRTVHRIVLRDLRTVYRNKTWKSAVLARLVTVLDDAKNEFGILEGRDWMTDALVWLNYVNLDGEDVEMEGSSEEEIEDAEDEVSMDKGGDQEVEDIGEIVAGGYGHDEDMTEEGSVESEGSDMSVDDVQDL